MSKMSELAVAEFVGVKRALEEAKANPTVCVRPPYGCGKPIATDSFRDEISRREHGISGLCQSCQDAVFDGSAAEIAEGI